MKLVIQKRHIVGLGALALIAAWVPGAYAATAEDRAKCEEMMKKMGAEAPHDHGKEKTGAPNAMTAEHMRCKQILAEPHPGHKDGDKHEQK